jgi:hypothetical protein
MIQGIIVVIVTAIVAVIPLLKFFLLPQMMKQGSASVSHYPVFTHNVVVDYVWGMVRSLNSFFVSYSLPLFGKIILCCVLFFAMFTLIAMLKDKTLISFVGAILCAWTLYFIAVACSFYGYNYWDGTLGCNNIGERYALFFVPIIIVTLVTGGKAFLSYFTNESLYKIAIMFFALWTLLFCTVEIVKIDVYGWEKDDVREVTQLWYESDAYNVPTLVHEWDDAMFNYYMVHNTNYNEEYDYNVKSAENWIRSADSETMEDGLQKMGYLDLDEYYYITPVVSYHDSYEAFMQVMDLYGYNIDVIYEGDSALLHVVKS